MRPLPSAGCALAPEAVFTARGREAPRHSTAPGLVRTFTPRKRRNRRSASRRHPGRLRVSQVRIVPAPGRRAEVAPCDRRGVEMVALAVQPAIERRTTRSRRLPDVTLNAFECVSNSCGVVAFRSRSRIEVIVSRGIKEPEQGNCIAGLIATHVAG